MSGADETRAYYDARAGEYDRRTGFDAIVGVNTFSYYPQKAAALAHYRELLRAEGLLVFLDMNGTSFNSLPPPTISSSTPAASDSS